MRHPTDEVLRIQVERYRAMTAARKLELATGLRTFAWESKLAALRAQHPELSTEALRVRLHECIGISRD